MFFTIKGVIVRMDDDAIVRRSSNPRALAAFRHEG
jgi:hypothetical protein